MSVSFEMSQSAFNYMMLDVTPIVFLGWPCWKKHLQHRGPGGPRYLSQMPWADSGTVQHSDI